jgi:hypothetical protein
VLSLKESQNRMRRNIIWVAWLALGAAVVGGCGGGGGGGAPPPTTQFVMTGTVLDVSTNNPVVGAVVTVAGNTATTDSQGKFRFQLSVAPTVQTYSIDGSAATPGCYTFWAKADSTVQNAQCIKLTLPLVNPTDLGTIYLMNDENPPPFPPSCL